MTESEKAALLVALAAAWARHDQATAAFASARIELEASGLELRRLLRQTAIG